MEATIKDQQAQNQPLAPPLSLCSKREGDGVLPDRRHRGSVQRHSEARRSFSHLHSAEQPAVRGHLQPAGRHLPGQTAFTEKALEPVSSLHVCSYRNSRVINGFVD